MLNQQKMGRVSGDLAKNENENNQAVATKFLGECMMKGALCANQAMETMNHMKSNGLATFSSAEEEKFQSKVFGRATASSIAIASGNLPLTSQFALQSNSLSVAPSSKIKTSEGSIDLQDPTTAKKIARSNYKSSQLE